MNGLNLPTGGVMTAFISGEQSVKTYPVAAGYMVNLIDLEGGKMYFKSTDANGVPGQTRIFEIKEVTPTHGAGDLVTRKEFNDLKAGMEQIMAALKELKPQAEGGTAK